MRSHPDIQLSEHISQVMLAADCLCQWHSDQVISQDIKKLLRKAVSLHDSGKTTDSFQKYIKNPPAYNDDPMEKAHTPMSTLLTLIVSKNEKNRTIK